MFILIYQKTYPIQEMLGLRFEISQPQANYWVHLLLPILKQTLAEMDLTPERGGVAVAESPLVTEADPDSVVGLIGEARTEIDSSGLVLLEGELWRARSKSPITAGSAVL